MANKSTRDIYSPDLVNVSVSDRNDIDTARLNIQLVNVATELPVLRAHRG